MEIFAGVTLLTVGILLTLSTLQQWMMRKFIPAEHRNTHNAVLMFLLVLTLAYYLSIVIVL